MASESWQKHLYRTRGKTMKRIIFSLFAVATLLISSSASAQEIERNDKIVDAKFILVSSSLVASTVFDVETTFANLKKPGVYEGNPPMRSVVNAGRPATYAFAGGVNTGIIYVSYRIKKSKNPNIRKLWWLIPVISTVSHTFAGGFNFRFVL